MLEKIFCTNKTSYYHTSDFNRNSSITLNWIMHRPFEKQCGGIPVNKKRGIPANKKTNFLVISTRISL